MPALRALLGGRPVRVEVSDVHIWDPFGKEVLGSARTTVGLRLGKLVRAQLWGLLPFTDPDLELHLEDAVVDEVHCHIAPDRTGAVNMVAAFARRGAPSDGRGGMVLSVGSSIIHDGSFSIRSEGWAWRLDHFSAVGDHLRYSSFLRENRPGRPAFTYAVSRMEATRGAIEIGEVQVPITDAVATDFHAMEPRPEDMVIVSTLHALGSELHANGGITNLYAKDRGIQMKLEASHLLKILALLPSKDFVRGNAAATAHLEGPFQDLVATGSGKHFELHASGVEAHDASATVHYAKGVLKLRDGQAGLWNGTARASATLDWIRHALDADVRLHDIHPLDAKKLLPVALFACVASVLPRMLSALKTNGEVAEHVKFGKVDLTLHQRAGEALPSRIVLHAPL